VAPFAVLPTPLVASPAVSVTPPTVLPRPSPTLPTRWSGLGGTLVWGWEERIEDGWLTCVGHASDGLADGVG